MIVVDANVAVKWFLPEPLSDMAEHLLESTALRAAPDHIFGEVGETLRRVVRQGGISAETARTSLAKLPDLVQSFPTRDLAQAAFEIALQTKISNYDALYVAAAERWDGLLVTADERMIAALRDSPWQALAHGLATPLPPFPGV